MVSPSSHTQYLTIVKLGLHPPPLRNLYAYIYYNLAHQLLRLFQFSIYLYEQKLTRGFCAFPQTQLLLVNIIGGSVMVGGEGGGGRFTLGIHSGQGQTFSEKNQLNLA